MKIGNWNVSNSLSEKTATILLHTAVIVLLLQWAFPLAAQSTAVSNITVATQLQDVVREGAELESKGNWRAAVNLYEKTLKSFPEAVQFRNRARLCRVHLDVSRRYNDSSYKKSINQLDLMSSKAVFREVLTKIDTYFYITPDWKKLVKNGLWQLQTAIQNDQFRNYYKLKTDNARDTAFKQRIDKWLEQQDIRNYQDVVYATEYISRQTNQTYAIPPQAAVLEIMSGSISLLDRYSSYLTGSELDDMFSQINGNFVGLGVELRILDKCLLIDRVIPSGPAGEAGIKKGDRIIEVNRKIIPQIASAKAADLLKGVEGTRVEIVLVATDGSVRRLSLTRRQVIVPSVEDVKILDKDSGIGYLRIRSFQKNTADDLEKVLWQLHKQGMQRLVIDVRGNPGGLVDSAVAVADFFIDKGTIVATRGRSVNEDVDYQAHDLGTWDMPLAVLVDAKSASAAEIFAGAVQDHQRAMIVGVKSFGKGSVQGIFPLASYNSGLRLTTARFYSPDGHMISQRGVRPDKEVNTVGKPLADGSLPLEQVDPVLAAGVDLLRDRKVVTVNRFLVK
ncbi:MAG: peptidase S41 [Planctomycetaceae bacterium]|nr:peptidase S41 [Planctomycetaceae bacterium]|tara:strand:+ start:405 stop:2090 length:1686 start_codon:yes stop_codon:yes gene_type:complete